MLILKVVSSYVAGIHVIPYDNHENRNKNYNKYRRTVGTSVVCTSASGISVTVGKDTYGYFVHVT